MADLARILAAHSREISEQRRRARGRSREGVVAQANPGAGLFRVNLGTEERPFLTGWIPAEALSTGTLSIQAEPVVGQHVRVTSESGDLTDAVVALSSFNDEAQRPGGPGGVLRVVVGGSSITADGDQLRLSSNGATIVLSSGGVAISGPSVTHGGTNIGRTHRHGGVDTGSGTSGTPT